MTALAPPTSSPRRAGLGRAVGRVVAGAGLLLAPCANGQTNGLARSGAALTATAKVGTHENAAGLRAHGAVPLRRWERHAIWLRGGLGAEVLVEDLGLPGTSAGAQPVVELAYGFGAPVQAATADPLQHSTRRHEIAVYAVGYLDTDGTSQAAGGVRYRRATGTTTLEVAYENDALVQTLRDEFRTAALRVHALRTDRTVPVGVGARFMLWTGTTDGLGRLDREDTYDLTGQLGAEYPHGILALDLTVGRATASVGVDSEGIRSAIQNTFHRLIDDGQIPRLPGREPRLFLRLALNEGGGLY